MNATIPRSNQLRGKIVFTSNQLRGKIVFKGIRSDSDEHSAYITVINASGEGQEKVLGVGLEPNWNPDGKEIVFVRMGKLCLTDGNGEKQNVIFESESEMAEEPVWSMDGQSILFASSAYEGNCHYLNIINRDGSNLRRVYQADGYIVSPTWSADTNIIIYSRHLGKFTDENEHFQTYKLYLDTKKIVQLTFDGNNTEPCLSPDGKLIAFIKSEIGFGPRLWIMNEDGSNQRRIACNYGRDRNPSWSPDGEMIVFTSNRRINSFSGDEIFAIDISGKNEVQITRSAVGLTDSNLDPSWCYD